MRRSPALRPRRPPPRPRPRSRMFHGTEPPVIGFVGPSGAGKTTLLERLLARWARSGWRVGVIKHAHHALRPDDPNTDTARLARAGAAAVRAAPWEEPWHAAVRRLVEQDPCLDWIVAEGYHAAPVVQILVVRDARDAAAERERARGWVVGVVAGGRGSQAGGVRAWTPADVAELAAFVA
ncbi:MAG: molybdopterin-guanine dinucleotide biosynthesis protein MobB, partial [Clostridia bacterium]|nr:molybdopterin-guanine dinucleotide biosynthesis protein MobB [Clostridia bacterium]